MARLRGVYWRRYAAMVALWGLFVQLATAAVALPLTFAPIDPAAKAAGYTTLVICTGTGMKRITLDPQGNPVEEQESDSDGEHCRLCQLNTVSVLPVSTQDADLAPWQEFVSTTPVADQTCYNEHHCLCPDSRAPPLSL